MRKFVLPAIVFSFLTAPGCGRGISEGVSVATGAKGRVLYIGAEPASGALAGRYAAVKLEGFTGQADAGTPAAFDSMVRGEFERMLADKNLMSPGGGTLIIRGRYLHYETAPLVEHVSRPVEQVIVRVELVDSKSGKVLARARCVGRTKTSLMKGADTKAEGLAKALVKLLEKQLKRPE